MMMKSAKENRRGKKGKCMMVTKIERYKIATPWTYNTCLLFSRSFLLFLLFFPLFTLFSHDLLALLIFSLSWSSTDIESSVQKNRRGKKRTGTMKFQKKERKISMIRIMNKQSNTKNDQRDRKN